jgi:hypothetical protein
MFDFALLHEKRVVGNVIADTVHAGSMHECATPVRV